MDKKVVLVLCATGKQGLPVLKYLTKNNKCTIRAFVRDPSKLKEFKNRVEVIQGDLKREEDVMKAMKGVHTLVTILDPWGLGGADQEVECGKKIHEMACKNGVQHIVYSSVASADQKTGIPFFESKLKIEEHLKSCGIPMWSIIRPVYFMDNFLAPNIKKSIESGTLQLPLKPNQKLEMIATNDIGVFIGMAVENPKEWNKKMMEIAGDNQTMEEYAKTMGCKFQETSLSSLPNDEYRMMYKWFQEGGYKADISACKKMYPNLMDFKTWVAQMGLIHATP